jgi:hypothetical protein
MNYNEIMDVENKNKSLTFHCNDLTEEVRKLEPECKP